MMWPLVNPRTRKVLGYVNGSRAEALASAQRLANRVGSVGVMPNPVRRPVVGEVWHGLRGDRCKILRVTGGSVTVLQLDTGHRVTSDLADFLATYKPPARSNPKRKGRNPRGERGQEHDLPEAYSLSDADAGKLLRAMFGPWFTRPKPGESVKDPHHNFTLHRPTSRSLPYYVTGDTETAREMIGRTKNPRARLTWHSIYYGRRSGYSAHPEIGNYKIHPRETASGRAAGYGVTFENVKGALPGGLHQDLGSAGSPNEAKRIALAHYEQHRTAPNPSRSKTARHRRKVQGRFFGSKRVERAYQGLRRARGGPGELSALAKLREYGAQRVRRTLTSPRTNPKGRFAIGTRVYVAHGPGRTETGIVTGSRGATVFVAFADLPDDPQALRRANLIPVSELQSRTPNPKRSDPRSEYWNELNEDQRNAVRAALRDEPPGRFKDAAHYAAVLAALEPEPNPKGRKAPGAIYDALGNGIAVGSVLIGTGLQNAGRAYTVKIIRGKRVQLEEHLTGRLFWTFPSHYRVDVNQNPGLRRMGPSQTWHFGHGFSVTLPLEAIAEMSGPGPADEAVEYWSRQIIRPRQASKDAVRAELREYGAWDAEELADDGENWRRILWIAATSLADEGPIRNRRRRQPKGPNRNPRGGNTIARARDTFRRLNETEPERITRVRAPRGAPPVGVQLGRLKSFVYESDKYAGTPDNPKGVPQLYEHRTSPPHPVLATDPEGRELYIVGGKMRQTPDGFIH
jgi:hypothetical protein